MEAILRPTRNGGQAPKAFGALWPSFAPDYEVPLAQVNPLASSLWRRSMALLEQVGRSFGAGRQVVWRRCDIWEWTCATPGRRVVFCGAGHRAFSTPAPIRTHTCAKKSIHLRQLAWTPAPRAWACRSVNGTSRTLQDRQHLRLEAPYLFVYMGKRRRKRTEVYV